MRTVSSGRGQTDLSLLSKIGGVGGPPLQVLVVQVRPKDVRAHVVADTVDVPVNRLIVGQKYLAD